MQRLTPRQRSVSLRTDRGNLEDIMTIQIKKTDQLVAFSNADGKPCGTYHYMDKFKSFFRGLYTPSGKQVVASPPPDHPHHKGLQFGLCTSEVNFWEEDKASEPPDNQLTIGMQHNTKPGVHLYRHSV